MAQLIDDRYELLDVIASGGMATVWRARDTRLERDVALKRPHPAPSDHPSQQRMDREARAAAALNHPNLVTVYDYGRDDDGPFLVMELVEGQTLQDVGEEIDRDRAIDIGTQLASALAALHAAGIIHRDIKPANVLMSERGPLLTDFGVALHPEVTAQITQPGKVVATPSYAAPEVLQGQAPTTSSDVFSLAVVIYELVAGERPAGPARDFPPLADDHIETVLRPALSVSPEDRSAAAALGAGLGGAAPTLTTMPVAGPAVLPGGSTMVMDPIPADEPTRAAAAEGSPPRSQNWRWPLAAVATVAIVLLLSAQIAPNSGTLAADETTTTVVLATSSSAVGTTTTTTTTTPTTTTSTAAVDTVEEARDELEAILLEEPRSEIKPHEVRDIMKKVDEAIEAAEEGDHEEAAKKLTEVAEKLDKLDEDQRTRAFDALRRLAELLGLRVEEDGGSDDD